MKWEWPSTRLMSAYSMNTVESCAWAKDNAHSLRYEAQFDIVPSTYSMVSMSWCTNISLKRKPCPCGKNCSSVFFMPVVSSYWRWLRHIVKNTVSLFLPVLSAD